MPIELKEERIPLSREYSELFGRALIETDIIVPDILPDIARILKTSVTSYIPEATVTGDSITITGSAIINIIYMDDNAHIHAINSNQSYSKNLDAPNTNGEQLYVTPNDTILESLETSLINSRKFSVKALLTLSAKLFSLSEITIPVDVPDTEDFEVKHTAIKSYSFFDTKMHDFSHKEAFEIPTNLAPVDEILHIEPTGKITEYKPAGDKLVVKGEFKFCILYISETDDPKIEHCCFTAPFTHVIDIPDLGDDAFFDISCAIKNLSHSLREDSDGDLRTLILEISAVVLSHISATTKGDVITDIYAVNANTAIESKSVIYNELQGALNSQISINESIAPGSAHPIPKAILWSYPSLTIGDTIIDGDMITTTGNMDILITYLSDDDSSPIASYKASILFEGMQTAANITAKSTADVKCTITDLSVIPIANGFNVSANIENNVRIISKKTLDYVDAVTTSEQKEATSKRHYSVKVYFVQKGDTLWDIAKRYRKKVSDIVSLNKIENPDLIKPGQQIIIGHI